MISMFKIICSVMIVMVFSVIGADAINQSICSPGEKVILYPNGSLRSCSMKDDSKIDDVRCKGQNQIIFYDNGRLDTCILAQSSTVSGQKCKEFGPISFYPDGKFRSCVKE